MRLKKEGLSYEAVAERLGENNGTVWFWLNPARYPTTPSEPVTKKRCSACREEKPASEFHRRRGTGLQTYCKPCKRARRQTKRGVSPEQYVEMLRNQGGVCAICEGPETTAFNGTVRALALDHCHKTGRVRGLLCGKCNTLLGWAQDDPAVLRAAIEYLAGRR